MSYDDLLQLKDDGLPAIPWPDHMVNDTAKAIAVFKQCEESLVSKELARKVLDKAAANWLAIKEEGDN